MSDTTIQTASSQKAMSNLSVLYSDFRTKKVKKGEILFLADSSPEVAYAIKSGYVRSYTLNDNLEEHSVSFVRKDELFPISWLFAKSQTPLFNYIAHTDCELYVMEPEEFHANLKQDPELSNELLAHLVSDSVTKMLEIQALEQSTAISKLLLTLDYFCISYGKRILNNVIRIDIPLTQKDLASFTGLARETVTSEIIKLKKHGVLTVKKKYYTINTTELKAIAHTSENEIPHLN